MWENICFVTVVLASLQIFGIGKCPKLLSLPEEMRHLTSLTRLMISGCPTLEERCNPETGEDWPKIAHIPNVDIGWHVWWFRYVSNRWVCLCILSFLLAMIMQHSNWWQIIDILKHSFVCCCFCFYFNFLVIFLILLSWRMCMEDR